MLLMLCRLHSNQTQQKKKVKMDKVFVMLTHNSVVSVISFISGKTLSEEKASGFCEEKKISSEQSSQGI